MLTYSFSEINTGSLYEYLYQCIRKDILEGKLKSGEKLPSKRSFAKNLGVSTITVENAYAQLMAEGYIYSLPKKGYYVSDIQAVSCEAAKSSEIPELPELPGSPDSLLCDLTSNQTDADYFPFSIWSKLIRELLNDHRDDLLTSPPCGGILYLRQAISEQLLALHGVSVRPQQIIIGAGTEYLYGILIQLLGYDKVYGIEDPGYAKIARIYRSHHIVWHPVPMDSSGIRIGKLTENAIDIAHISPSHQFPTGITMSIGRRHELLKWAYGNDSRYIIEDDYDSEFRLSGQMVPTLQSIDTREKVIYINTFTKTLSSTVRIAYMVLPPHLVGRFYESLSFYTCPVSTFEQYTLGGFIEKGYFEKHINRLRTHYRRKLELFLKCLRETPAAAKIHITRAGAGLHFLMTVDTGLSDRDFCRKALSMGIKLRALSEYYHEGSSDTDHIFVINYASLQEAKIPIIADRLSNLINS